MKTTIPEKIETMEQTKQNKDTQESIKDAHERLVEKEKIRLCYSALSAYSTAQYFGAVGERKLRQVEEGVVRETVDGMEKSMKEVYWEAVKFRRLYLDHMKAYKEALEEFEKLGFTEEELLEYGQQRGVTMERKENIYKDGDE